MNLEWLVSVGFFWMLQNQAPPLFHHLKWSSERCDSAQKIANSKMVGQCVHRNPSTGSETLKRFSGKFFVLVVNTWLNVVLWLFFFFLTFNQISSEEMHQVKSPLCGQVGALDDHRKITFVLSAWMCLMQQRCVTRPAFNTARIYAIHSYKSYN